MARYALHRLPDLPPSMPKRPQIAEPQAASLAERYCHSLLLNSGAILPLGTPRHKASK
jgi:hypothetical protein